MSQKLTLPALMALAIFTSGIVTDAEAGPCKRVGEQRNKNGKCETVRTVQRRATPPQAVLPVLRPTAPVAPPPVATVLSPPQVAPALHPSPLFSFVVGTSMPTTIPASYTAGHVLDSCHGVVVLGGVFTPQFTSVTSNVRTFGYHRSPK